MFLFCQYLALKGPRKGFNSSRNGKSDSEMDIHVCRRWGGAMHQVINRLHSFGFKKNALFWKSAKMLTLQLRVHLQLLVTNANVKCHLTLNGLICFGYAMRVTGFNLCSIKSMQS